MSRKPLFTKIAILLVCVAAVSAFVYSQRGDFISPDDAASHVGQKLTVRGKVFEVHATKNGTVFMNMGAPFPDQTFTVVCFQGVVPVDVLRKFEGKRVSVTGEIKDYKGQVEIILNSLEQIK